MVTVKLSVPWNGVAQLGFWCVEDLVKAGRSVYIVPIGIQYRYVKPSWRKLDLLLSQLKQIVVCLCSESISLPPWPGKGLLSTTLSLGWASPWQNGAVLYPLSPNPTRTKLASNGWIHHPNQMLATRLQTLLHTALQVAEDYFWPGARKCDWALSSLEEAGWTYIYREDLQDLKALSPLDEFGRDCWRSQSKDVTYAAGGKFCSGDGNLCPGEAYFERFAETALLMFDMLARIKGDNHTDLSLGQRWVQITVGEPLSSPNVGQLIRQAIKRQDLPLPTWRRTRALRRWFLIPPQLGYCKNLKLKKALLLASLADVGTNTKNLMSFTIRR